MSRVRTGAMARYLRVQREILVGNAWARWVEEKWDDVMGEGGTGGGRTRADNEKKFCGEEPSMPNMWTADDAIRRIDDGA